MQTPRILAGFFLVFVSVIASADVPVTFQSGAPANAADDNQNFTDLDTRLNASLGGISVSRFFSSADGVASASCPANTLVLSANCDCEGDGATRNYGILFVCQVAGNGGVAGCFPEGVTFNPQLLDPRATVEVVCGGAVRNDGTTITPVPLAQSAVLSGAEKSTPDTASSKAASDELEAAVKKVNDQMLDVTSAMKNAKKRK